MMDLLDLLGYWVVVRHLVLLSLGAFSLAEEDLLDVRSGQLRVYIVGDLLLQSRKTRKLLIPEER